MGNDYVEEIECVNYLELGGGMAWNWNFTQSSGKPLEVSEGYCHDYLCLIMAHKSELPT